MSYKITRGRVPTGRSVTAAEPRPARPRGQPQNRVPPDQGHPQTPIQTAQNPHTPYSVCPPMNSLMIDVGGIAAISSGESATI